jgi:hypothetical protein
VILKGDGSMDVSPLPTLVPPVRVAPAYEDREAVWQTVRSHSPYPLMAGSEGYVELMGDHPLYPFFRSVWAQDGVAVDEETERLLLHQPFIEGAKQLFGASVVRPTALIVNVMGPQADGGAHVDMPTFRGLNRGALPVWLLVTMGMSGLFDRWAVRIAGALTWFHEQSDGEFQYWPHGVNAPHETETGPFGNVALLADNDLMTHRVGRIGDPDAFNREVSLSLKSSIHAVGIDDWEIRDSGGSIGTLQRHQVRVSLLWKAVTFADERAARQHDEHDDDLDLDTIVAIFAADLDQRGLVTAEPSDPRSDVEWAKALTSTYMPGHQ